MVRESVRVSSRILFAALALGLAFLCGTAAAGESVTVPQRLQKIKQGDWILYRDDDGAFSKETVTNIERVEKEYIVYYTIEAFDKVGKAVDKPQEVARFLSDEQKENAETLEAMKDAKAERKTVTIDGKKVPVVIFSKADEDGHTVEQWYSDAISIDGRVAMRVLINDTHGYIPFETVAFGTGKTKPDIKKYLLKKE